MDAIDYRFEHTDDVGAPCSAVLALAVEDDQFVFRIPDRCPECCHLFTPDEMRAIIRGGDEAVAEMHLTEQEQQG